MNRTKSIFALAVLSSLFAACATAPPAPEALDSPAYNRALTILRTQARSQDPSVRANCIEALEATKDQRVLDLIEQGLHDDQWVVRFAAAMAAGKRKADTVRPVLNTLVIHDPNGSVRVACIYALSRLGDSSHMNDLPQFLESTDPSTRANTALILGLMGDPSAIPLLQTLVQQGHDEPDIRVRFELTAAMARLGDEAAQQVIAGWAINKFAEDQWNAMQVCSELPPAMAINPLLAGLENAPARIPANALPNNVTENEVRYLITRRQLVAARSLARLHNGQGVQVAVDTLNSNQDPTLRALALMALGDMLTPDQIVGIAPWLNDSDEGVRRAAATAIVHIYDQTFPLE